MEAVIAATNWRTVLGIIAALCTTLAFVPQLVSMKKRESAELSGVMLAMYLTGLGLWLAYGLAIRAVPVIASNVAAMAIVSAVTLRKAAASRRRAQRRLRIAIDMDEVMADALGEHLRRYNAAFGATVTRADLRGRHLENWVPAEQRQAVEAMFDESFFADLTVMPGCQEVVAELAARYEVLIVTAAMDVPCSFEAKFRWLRRYFPFIPPAQIVFCGDKGVIDADYLIDDRPRHFVRFNGQPILFSAPHNADETRYVRVDSWLEVREIFSRLETRTSGASRAHSLRDQPAAC